MSGFSMRPAVLGTDGPMVNQVSFDPKDASAVIVRYPKPVEKAAPLNYGLGLDPYANIVDSKGMAVPAFGPIRVEQSK